MRWPIFERISCAGIFVVGDAATVIQGGRALPGVAQVAIQQGRYVGGWIAREIGGRKPPRPFRYSDRGNMAVIGKNFAIMESAGSSLRDLFLGSSGRLFMSCSCRSCRISGACRTNGFGAISRASAVRVWSMRRLGSARNAGTRNQCGPSSAADRYRQWMRKRGRRRLTQGNDLHFRGADGHPLSARLDCPEGTPRAYALFAHCFTCSKDSLAAVHVGRGLAAQGIAVLRFDFTGLGRSSGEFADTNFSSNVADIIAAAAFLRESFASPPILIGHSLGGTAVLVAAESLPEASVVATIGAPYEPDHVRRLLAPASAEIEARGEAEVLLGERKFRDQAATARGSCGASHPRVDFQAT